MSRRSASHQPVARVRRAAAASSASAHAHAAERGAGGLEGIVVRRRSLAPPPGRVRTVRAVAGLSPASCFDEVLEHRHDLGRRAELEEHHALVGPAGVAARPVVDVAGPVRLLVPVGVADGDRALDDVAPVRALAQVAGQPDEQRREVGAGGQVDVAGVDVAALDAAGLDLAELHLQRDVLERVAHGCPPRSWPGVVPAPVHDRAPTGRPDASATSRQPSARRRPGAWAVHATGALGRWRVWPMRRAGAGAHDGGHDQTAPAASRAESIGRADRARPRSGSGRGGDARPWRRRRPRGGPMDGAQQLDEIMPLLQAVVDAIEPRPARRRDAVRELHGDGRARAHDRRRLRVRAGVPGRGRAERAARPRRTVAGSLARRDGRPARRRPRTEGAQERTIAAPVRRGARRGVRPLRRLRRPRARLGPRHRHRSGLRAAATSSSPRSTRSPARRCSPRCATATRSPPRPKPPAERHAPRTARGVQRAARLHRPRRATTMTITTLTRDDLDAIKGRQQATWASGDYAVIGTTLQIVGESLCEAVDVAAGSRVLDVAAGNGNASLAAARRGARSIATDYVDDAARRRAGRRAEADGLAIDARGRRRRGPAVRRRRVRRRAVDLRRDVRARPAARRGRAGPRVPARRPHRPRQLDARGLRRPDVQDRRRRTCRRPPACPRRWPWGTEDRLDELLRRRRPRSRCSAGTSCSATGRRTTSSTRSAPTTAPCCGPGRRSTRPGASRSGRSSPRWPTSATAAPNGALAVPSEYLEVVAHRHD